eukprot:TRINITY_DN1265_c0_g1_i1.p1 TRINITY_DN1265_c0_g1~~TRINITY_DN1265_c0_g1_i1.p1  ORF type:complete len:894 (-),score=246.59 TRINITY_DN1265_c0_g1_i1:52-2733(-)
MDDRVDDRVDDRGVRQDTDDDGARERGTLWGWVSWESLSRFGQKLPDYIRLMGDYVPHTVQNVVRFGTRKKPWKRRDEYDVPYYISLRPIPGPDFSLLSTSVYENGFLLWYLPSALFTSRETAQGSSVSSTPSWAKPECLMSKYGMDDLLSLELGTSVDTSWKGKRIEQIVWLSNPSSLSDPITGRFQSSRPHMAYFTKESDEMCIYSPRLRSVVHRWRMESEVYRIICKEDWLVVVLNRSVHVFDITTYEQRSLYPKFPVEWEGKIVGMGEDGGKGKGKGKGNDVVKAVHGQDVAVSPRWIAIPAIDCPTSQGPGDKEKPPSSVKSGVDKLLVDPDAFALGEVAMDVAKAAAKGMRKLGRWGKKALNMYLNPDAPLPSSGKRPSVPIPRHAGVVRVVDLMTQECLFHFHAFVRHPIGCLEFDATGTLLAAGSSDGHQINVFQLCPGVLPIHLYRLVRGVSDATIRSISFDSLGMHVLASTTKTTHVFRLKKDDGIEIGDNVADASPSGVVEESADGIPVYSISSQSRPHGRSAVANGEMGEMGEMGDVNTARTIPAALRIHHGSPPERVFALPQAEFVPWMGNEGATSSSSSSSRSSSLSSLDIVRILTLSWAGDLTLRTFKPQLVDSGIVPAFGKQMMLVEQRPSDSGEVACSFWDLNRVRGKGEDVVSPLLDLFSPPNVDAAVGSGHRKDVKSELERVWVSQIDVDVMEMREEVPLWLGPQFSFRMLASGAGKKSDWKDRMNVRLDTTEPLRVTRTDPLPTSVGQGEHEDEDLLVDLMGSVMLFPALPSAPPPPPARSPHRKHQQTANVTTMGTSSGNDVDDPFSLGEEEEVEEGLVTGRVDLSFQVTQAISTPFFNPPPPPVSSDPPPKEPPQPDSPPKSDAETDGMEV